MPLNFEEQTLVACPECKERGCMHDVVCHLTAHHSYSLDQQIEFGSTWKGIDPQPKDRIAQMIAFRQKWFGDEDPKPIMDTIVAGMYQEAMRLIDEAGKRK